MRMFKMFTMMFVLAAVAVPMMGQAKPASMFAELDKVQVQPVKDTAQKRFGCITWGADAATFLANGEEGSEY